MNGLELFNTTEIIFDRSGYLLIFITSFVESSPFGWMTPGGLVLAMGGFFSSGGHLRLVWVIIYGLLGTWLMQLLAYYLGYKYGMKIARTLKQIRNAERAEKIMKKQGAIVMTTMLTSNITRFWVGYISGMKNFDRLKFIQYSFVASISWTAVWSVTGFIFGGERENLEKLLPRLGAFSWILLLIALTGIVWTSKREYNEYEDSSDRD